MINRYIEDIKKFKSVITDENSFMSASKGFHKKLSIDIGCGNGEVLVDNAKKNKDIFYIGFELQYKEVYRTALKIERAGIKNALVARIDAALIPELIKKIKSTVVEANIFFPDPWPKKRHRKHRIIKKSYIERLVGTMDKGARIKLKTDNDGYFLEILDVFKSLDNILSVEALSRDYAKSEYSKGEYITPFERIFLSQGLLINYLLARTL